MTAVGITYFEKPRRDKNVDNCQQSGVKFGKKPSLNLPLILYQTDNSPEIKDMLKNFQFQEDTEASLYGNFKRIINYVKFVPCVMHCVLFE